MMKRVFALALLGLASAAHAEISEPLRWSYTYILATATDFRDLGPVARHLTDDESLRTTDMLDLMAELLATRKPSDAKEELARSVLVTLLGRADNPRYFAVLRAIATEKDESASRKSARHALDRKKVPTVEQFKPGMSNLASLRDEYAAAEKLAKMPRHIDLDAVFAYAGQPQAASSRIRRRGPTWEYQRLTLYYRGLGRVELQLGHDGWIARRVVVAPLAFEDFMPYREDPAKYGQLDDNALAITQLVSDDRGAIRLMLDRSEQYDHASLELLDTAAERLLHDMTLSDKPLSRDDYDWMCVLLTHEGGLRYAKVLKSVANATQDEKIRAFAMEKIDATKNVGAPPYVPGTITFEGQRARYPSLYPKRSYYFGRP
jgi:hypothetical protein